MAETTIGLMRVVLSSNSAQFTNDMGKASKSVDSFDKEAKDAAKSLSGMASGFDGSKIANEADKIAKGLGHVGDKASVTTRLMQGLIAVISVRAVVNATKDVLEFTGKLTDLAGKTGITTEGLQRLNYVTSQSGLSLEQVAQGAAMLGRNLVGGNKSAVAAVEALNFKVRDLIEMGPERAFLAIGEAIAKVPNPMEQAALATAVFGRAGADYLPAFTSNMKELADQAQASGAILSDDMVRAGDSAGDALGRLSNVGSALLGKVIIPLLPYIERLANWIGANLPPAIDKATRAMRELITVGLALDVWLAETAVSITETVAAVPVLGRVFGQTTADVAHFDKMAIEARKNLREFVAQGSEPTKASLQGAIPMVTGFSEAMGEAGRKAKKLHEDLSMVSGLIDPLTQMMIEGTIVIDKWGTESREAALSMIELEVALARANRQLVQIMPLLENTFRADYLVPFKAAVKESDTSTRSFFAKLIDNFKEAGIGAGTFSQLFQQAFLGGSGALGAIQAFATQGLSALLGMIPGVGMFVSAFAGPIVAMISKLTRKFTDFFRRIFGGASAEEMAGRGVVAEFESQLEDSLTAAQAAEAGTDAWKRTVIALRDAYLAAGRTEEEALADAKRLWESSKQGAEEAARVIEEIRRKMQGLTQDSHVIDIEYRVTAPDGAGPIDFGNPDYHHTQPVDPGFASGTMGRSGDWFKDFRGGFNTMLHGVEAVLTPRDVPSFVRDMAPVVAGGGSVSNNYFMVAIPTEAVGDPRRMASAVFEQVPSGLEIDKGGMATAFEQLVHNVIQTYYRRG